MANCSWIKPIPYSPMSTPLPDQGPSSSANYVQWPTEQEDEDARMTNPHITGLAISASGIYGQPNYNQHDDCIVCGKPFATNQKEVTLGYLKKTHVSEENFPKNPKKKCTSSWYESR